LVGARVNQHVSIVRTKNELLPQYLSFYFASPIMQTKITIENYGATRQALTKSAIENFRIQLPTLPEQQHIVEEIEKRFAVADEMEKAVNEGLEKADKLKQSILKKAFEGKLAPQNPNDEPASVLLERIKKEQKPTKGKKK
jgi:type I restriction enzyme S subunit